MWQIILFPKGVQGVPSFDSSLFQFPKLCVKALGFTPRQQLSVELCYYIFIPVPLLLSDSEINQVLPDFLQKHQLCQRSPNLCSQHLDLLSPHSLPFANNEHLVRANVSCTEMTDWVKERSESFLSLLRSYSPNSCWMSMSQWIECVAYHLWMSHQQGRKLSPSSAPKPGPLLLTTLMKTNHKTNKVSIRVEIGLSLDFLVLNS